MQFDQPNYVGLYLQKYKQEFPQWKMKKSDGFWTNVNLIA